MRTNSTAALVTALMLLAQTFVCIPFFLNVLTYRVRFRNCAIHSRTHQSITWKLQGLISYYDFVCHTLISATTATNLAQATNTRTGAGAGSPTGATRTGNGPAPTKNATGKMGLSMKRMLGGLILGLVLPIHFIRWLGVDMASSILCVWRFTYCRSHLHAQG